MKSIGEIMEVILNDLEHNHIHGKLSKEDILKEKACLIDDIFRVMKRSTVFCEQYIALIGYNAVKTFDELYEMSIYELELLLANMSAELSLYMQENQRQSMRTKFIPKYHYRRNNDLDIDNE